MDQIATPEKIKPELKPTDYQRRFAQGRAEARMTLQAVADAAGISLQAISQFEKGKSSISLAHFLPACDAMKLRVEWVLKDIGPMFDGARPEPNTRKKRPAKRATSE